MENYKLVLPGHLNHYGYLFGGTLLMWVDEVSWIAASLDYPGCKFVTVGMDRVEFKKSVRQGSLLRFEVDKKRAGTTSVQYTVNVYRENLGTRGGGSVFTTTVTFVCLDETGKKRTLSKCGGCDRGVPAGTRTAKPRSRNDAEEGLLVFRIGRSSARGKCSKTVNARSCTSPPGRCPL